jgi:hypothetical protein
VEDLILKYVQQKVLGGEASYAYIKKTQDLFLFEPKLESK